MLREDAPCAREERDTFMGTLGSARILKRCVQGGGGGCVGSWQFEAKVVATLILSGTKKWHIRAKVAVYVSAKKIEQLLKRDDYRQMLSVQNSPCPGEGMINLRNATVRHANPLPFLCLSAVCWLLWGTRELTWRRGIKLSPIRFIFDGSCFAFGMSADTTVGLVELPSSNILWLYIAR